eukprot:2996844-Amphidinium_carterae.1
MNFTKGKTEAIVYGPGDDKTRLCLALRRFAPEGSTIPVIPLGGGQMLRCVEQYDHLGVLSGFGASYVTHCSKRAAIARTQ